MRKVFLFLIAGFVFISVNAQNTNDFFKNYNNFSSDNFFDKVYVHTDKNVYYGGETIWFKVYLFDAKQNKPDTVTQLVVVELITPEKRVVFHKNILVKQATGEGYFFIPEFLENGDYQLRAYVNTMKNYSSEFFFVKDIFIHTDNKEYSEEFFRDAKKVNRKRKNIYVDYRIKKTGIEKNSWEIVYTLHDSRQKSISADFFIKNNKNEIIASVKNSPAGKIIFKTKPEEKYFIYVSSDTLKSIKIKLYFSEDGDVALRIDRSEGAFVFSLADFSLNNGNRKYNFVLEKDGKIYKSRKISGEEKILIKKNEIPAGIYTVLLLDGNKPVYENKIFNDYDKSKITVNQLVKNDTLYLVINRTTDAKADFSLSMTSASANEIGIWYYLNFYSSINPLLWYLIEPTNDFAVFADDKYDYLKIAENRIQKPEYQKERFVSISGNISQILTKLEAKNANVELYILNEYNDYYKITTDEHGNFQFDSLDYGDTIYYMIKAKTNNDKKFTVVHSKKYDTAEFYFANFRTMSPKQVKSRYREYQAEHQSKALYSTPDQIIYGSEIRGLGYSNVLDAIAGRVANYTRTANSSRFRGYTSFYATEEANEPLYLLDNVPVTAGVLEAVNINDIDRVEIVRNLDKAAIYGSQGAQGIIAVFTKEGYNISWGKTVEKTEGIFKSKKFEQVETDNPLKTYLWIPSLKTNKKILIVKIPLKNIGDNYVINIEGFDFDGNLYSVEVKSGK